MIQYVVPCVAKSIDTENSMQVARGWRMGNGELSVSWGQFQLGEDDKVLEMMMVMVTQQCECLMPMNFT